MGFFGALEGGDGSGKGTQAKLYADYARDELAKDVLELDFPRYGQRSAKYVEKYLNGDFGTVNQVPAELASLPYALDRFGTKDITQEYLERPNGLILTNRYSASNFAHQGTKFEKAADRQSFYEEMMWLEWDFLGIPIPDANIILLVKTSLAQANVDRKATRGYTNLKRDIHEADANHLEKAKFNYVELTELYPERFIGLDCMKDDASMRSIEIIQLDIRRIFQEQMDKKVA